MRKILFYSISTICFFAFSFQSGKAQSGSNTPVTGAPLAPVVSAVTPPANFPSATTNLNFVRTYVPMIPVTDITNNIFSLAPAPTNYKAQLKTTYVNGWGNPLESIVRGAPNVGSTATKDIISMADRRPSKTSNSFLPYAAPYGSHFQTSPFLDQQAYYSSVSPEENNMTFGQKVSYIDGSTPTSKVFSPGSSFVGNQNGVTTTTTIEDGDNHIKKYNYENGALVDQGEYAVNSLVKKYSVGQHNEKTLSFYDLYGNMVCRKVYMGESSGITFGYWSVTNYVYDDLGHLAYILSPKANNSDVVATLQTLSFGYTYDKFGQRVSTNTPGKANTDILVYDSKHRTVLMQSSLLQSSSQYMFHIYDSRDRVVLSGILTDSNTPAMWQSWLNDPTTTTIVPGSLLDFLVNGFNDVYPASIPNCEIDVINYYDHYPSSLSSVGFDNGFSTDYLTGINMVTPIVYKVLQGMLTASKVRVKDGITTTSDNWTTSKFFYDQKGNIIQVKTLNPWNTTAWDVTAMQYNFAGQVVQKIVKQNDIATNPVIKVAIVYNYDIYHNGRLLSVQQRINSDAWRDIADYQYDDFGRVSQKLLGGVEEQDYSYNIRGQLTSINKDYAQLTPESSTNKTFGCILDYDYGFTFPRYDGSISGMIWRGGGYGSPLNSYGYKYDAAQRLLSADFRTLINTGVAYWDNSATDYTMDNATYDENGNILSMHQRGTTATGLAPGPVDIDQLTYAYTPGTNQLQNVSDAASNYNVGDFTDGNISASTGTNDYNYDDDGNLSQDLNKGIANITYNELDKPLSVTFGNGGSITYVYGAAGNLVSRTVNDGLGGVPLVYRYWGGFVYQNDVLQYILHQEGRTRYLADSAAFRFDYFVKDHLGNVRTVVTADYSGMRYYFASHEIAAANTESSLFTNIDNVRDVKLGSTDATDNKAARLNGADPSRQIGTAILLHVMAGDKFNVSAQSYWEDSTGMAGTTSASSMLTAVINTLVGGAANVKGSDASATKLIDNAFSASNYGAYLKVLNTISNPNIPQAFINYLVFDEKMNLIPEESGAIQIGATAGNWQAMETAAPITAVRNGYVAIYMSNATRIDVYMDELSVAVYKGRLLQQQDYYPFGLTIEEGDATTDGDNVPNYFKFEGNEVYNDLGLNLQDFGARQYDYQTGRFVSVDPLADQQNQESLTPYHFCSNNPANTTDPGGMATGTTLGSALSDGGAALDGFDNNGNGEFPLDDQFSKGYCESTWGGGQVLTPEAFSAAALLGIINGSPGAAAMGTSDDDNSTTGDDNSTTNKSNDINYTPPTTDDITNSSTEEIAANSTGSTDPSNVYGATVDDVQKTTETASLINDMVAATAVAAQSFGVLAEETASAVSGVSLVTAAVLTVTSGLADIKKDGEVSTSTWVGALFTAAAAVAFVGAIVATGGGFLVVAAFATAAGATLSYGAVVYDVNHINNGYNP